MCAVDTAASLQSVVPKDTGLLQLSSSLEFSMTDMAPSLLRLDNWCFVLLTLILI
jgi:hypothetical protein